MKTTICSILLAIATIIAARHVPTLEVINHAGVTAHAHVIFYENGMRVGSDYHHTLTTAEATRIATAKAEVIDEATYQTDWIAGFVATAAK
jgi:hypothetical protein